MPRVIDMRHAMHSMASMIATDSPERQDDAPSHSGAPSPAGLTIPTSLSLPVVITACILSAAAIGEVAYQFAQAPLAMAAFPPGWAEALLAVVAILTGLVAGVVAVVVALIQLAQVPDPRVDNDALERQHKRHAARIGNRVWTLATALLLGLCAFLWFIGSCPQRFHQSLLRHPAPEQWVAGIDSDARHIVIVLPASPATGDTSSVHFPLKRLDAVNAVLGRLRGIHLRPRPEVPRGLAVERAHLRPDASAERVVAP
jgi:hypothetical protein